MIRASGSAVRATTWSGRVPLTTSATVTSSSTARKLVRTLNNSVRAFLSDSYRPLDNYDLATAVLPKLADLQARVMSCEVTDSRFYLKAVTDRVQGEVKSRVLNNLPPASVWLYHRPTATAA